MRRLAVVATVLALSGCGSSEYDRVGSGASIGAVTGALIGIVGGPVGVAVGAGIGAGVGAVAGGGTTPKQVDLGKPVWESGSSNSTKSPNTPQPLNPAPTGDNAVQQQALPPVK